MSMRRSKQQILYQFLPRDTFDYSDGRGIWKVTHLKTRDVSGEVSPEYILNRVLARVYNWDGNVEGFGSQRTEDYHFGEPKEVRAEPFPATFECDSCQKTHQYYGADDLESKNPGLACDRCGGNLSQYQFVSIHACGKMKQLRTGGCPQHGDNYVILDRRDSQRVQNFQWRCKIDGCHWSRRLSHTQRCGCDYTPPTDDESEDEDGMYTTVHRAGSVYYPHYLTTVNLHQAGIGYLQQNDEGSLKSLAYQMGLSDSSSLTGVGLNNKAGESDVDDDEVVQVYSQRSDIDSLEEAEQVVREQTGAGQRSVREKVDSLISLSKETDGNGPSEESELTRAGDELLQYVLSTTELETDNLDELAAGARERGFVDSADRIQTYHSHTDRLGIDSVRVIENFPVQTFVYGYSRGSRDEDGAKIVAFSGNDSDGDGTPIFVDRSETEAVQFDLNPIQVLLWLAVNVDGVDDPEQVEGSTTLPTVNSTNDNSVERARDAIQNLSEAERWAFLLNHLADIDDYGRFQTNTDDTVAGSVTEHIFKLLHTASHILLKQASSISGFDRTNLSEFLFPRALSFVVYANGREEFNIGGIRTMVEQELDNLLGQAKAHGNDCVYDPVCSQRGGACLSCLHVSEISCSYFNQVLSRRYLYGTRPNTDRSIRGYWRLDSSHDS